MFCPHSFNQSLSLGHSCDHGVRVAGIHISQWQIHGLCRWFHSLPLLSTQLGIEATELDRVHAGGNTLKELEV